MMMESNIDLMLESDTFGVWTEFTEKHRDQIVTTEEEINYKNCVELCWNRKNIRDKILRKLKYIATTEVKKNEKVAQEFRRVGDNCFKLKRYGDSLYKYSQSIINAKPGSKCLAIAYSSRSEAALKLGLIPQSINDIDMALKVGLPQDKIPVLKLRKAKALLSLKEYEKAEKALFDILNDPQAEGSVPLLEVRSMLESISGQKVSAEGFNIAISCDINYDLPKPVGGENVNFSSASAHLALFYDEHKGRHVVATEDLHVGDVLFVERPFAHSYTNNCNRCDSCGREAVSFIPCNTCTFSVYCSIDCKKEFWKSTHSFECNFGSMFKSLGVAHLGLRVLLSASSSFSELSEKLDQIVINDFSNGPISMKANGYNEIYNLVTNLEKFDKYDLIQYTLSAMIVAIYLRNHTPYFRKCPSDQDMKVVVSVLLRHIAQLVCNGQTISGNVFRRIDEQCLGPYPFKWKMSFNSIGSAIYPSVSMMNHSCLPCVISTFRGTFNVVRASRFIKKGEEVFNCYIPSGRTWSRLNRQEHLQAQYFFNCACEACTSKYDMRDIFWAWKCQNCMGPSIDINEVKSEETECRTCLNCGRVMRTTQGLEILEHKAYKNINKGEDFMIVGTESNTIILGYFLGALFSGRGVFYKFHTALIRAAENITNILYEMNEYAMCLKFKRVLLKSVKICCGSESIELAHQLEQMSDIEFSRIHEILHRSSSTQEAGHLAADLIEHLKESKRIYDTLCGQSEHTLMFDDLIGRAQRLVESLHPVD